MKVLFLLAVIQISKQQTNEDYTLITDFSQDSCVAQDDGTSSYYYTLDASNSVPTCTLYGKKYSGVSCKIDNPSKSCAPGFLCDKRCNGKGIDYKCETAADCTQYNSRVCGYYCAPDRESCMKYHANTDIFTSSYYTAVFKPKCLDDGSWAPKQCKGDSNGRCFCFDAHGKRIFGQALAKDSADMTCACSRKKADLLEDDSNWFVSFHCDSMGNYEEIQCNDGLCWCAEPKTGDLTSPMVPEKNLERLPCYNEAKIGSQYLRQCESELYAIKKITHEFLIHGVTEPNMRSVVCDGDGGYGAYNISVGKAYCTWRDGSIIGTWSSDLSGINIDDINCNCARDQKMQLTSQDCEGSGNYKAVQKSSKGYYCIDSDGFSKSPFIQANSAADVDCTIYY